MNLLKFHNKIKGYTQNRQPGIEADMEPKPIAELEEYKAAGKLENKVALITGGDWHVAINLLSGWASALTAVRGIKWKK